ncbi:EpsG family protein [uncultured Bifidobacterium sp.]|uniref:EpsG family protein n=1 Tax=uncultured Bifidobacterium sp. TaxID=165187 RepID=UPI0025973C45|nr:EpsG family protein [uncultured Bifidobacterium sp.]
MTAYIILILLCLFTDFVCRTRPGSFAGKALVVAIVSYIAVLTGFRYQVGGDYTHYIEVYDFINSPYIDRTYEEIGYRILTKVTYAFGWGPRSVFIISGIMLGIALYVFTKHVVDNRFWGFFLFLFVCGGSFFSSLNLMRQYMALSCCLVAYVLWRKQHPVWAALLFALGISFHRSLLIVLLLFPLRYCLRRNRTMTIIVIYLISFTVLVFGMDSIIAVISRIIPSWSGYADIDTTASRNALALLKAVIPNVLLLYGLTKRRSLLRDRELIAHDPYRSLVISGTITFAAMSICFAGIMILTRIAEFFAPFYFVYLCRLLQVENRGMKMLLSYSVYIYYLALTIVTIFVMNGNFVIPYQMGWEA